MVMTMLVCLFLYLLVVSIQLTQKVGTYMSSLDFKLF